MSTFNNIHCNGKLTIRDPESQNPVDVYESACLFREVSCQNIDTTYHSEFNVRQLGKFIFGHVVFKSDTPDWYDLFKIPYSNIQGNYTNSIKMHHPELWIHPDVDCIVVSTNVVKETTSNIYASFYTIVF